MQLELIHMLAAAPSDAPPVLFVHGAWHAAWCWERYFMPAFAAGGYDTWALSLRGHGASPCNQPLHRLRLSDYRADVLWAIRRIGRVPVMVGHSMGGLLIQGLLATGYRFPAAALLASIPPGGTGNLARRTALYRPRIAAGVMMTWDVRALVTEPTPDGAHFFSPKMPPAERESYINRFTHESFAAVAVDALFADLPRPRPTETPILVLGGAHDTLFRPYEVHATAHAWGTTAEIYPDMGHDLMLDPGWERVAARVMAHVATAGAPTHR